MDGTHHNSYGSYQLARRVVKGIRQNKLDLVKHIVDEYQGFYPAQPDPIDSFMVPASPMCSAEKSEGT